MPATTATAIAAISIHVPTNAPGWPGWGGDLGAGRPAKAGKHVTLSFGGSVGVARRT